MSNKVMKMSFDPPNCPSVCRSRANKKETLHRIRLNPSFSIQVSSILVKIEESGNSPVSKKISSATQKRSQTPNSFLSQENGVGIIGGVSAFSTLIFMEKLVWWSSRKGGEPFPFIVCSDPTLSGVSPVDSPQRNGKYGNHGTVIENLRRKREFLEQSGVGCLVMPCHISHVWHKEVSEGCSVAFLDVGDCVARELKEAKLKPIEAGSNVRIGILAADAVVMAGFYQDKLQNQGFEVVLPDKPTMEHIIIPAVEALSKKDREGARILLRIAVQGLLVRAVNVVILANDEFQDLLPFDDPLLKKCIDPMDALARSTIKWARATEKVHMH